MPQASVVIPSRGGSARLPRLLAALARQTLSDLEVVVVLDGDIDDSKAVLDRCPLPVKQVVFATNRGRSAALNAGFGAASGDVLIRCDDDLEPSAEWAKTHVAAHTDGGSRGVIGLYLNTYDDTPYARAYGRPADLDFRQTAYRTPPELRWRYWAGNVSVTRSTYDRVGEYSLDYRSYGWEDVDWGFRLHLLGLPVELVPELETVHHIPSTSTVTRSKRAYLSGAARRTFESRHGLTAHPPLSRPSGLWGVLVRGAAKVEDERRLEYLSRFIDWSLPRTPSWMGRKLVALSVESASLAGYDRPSSDRTIL